jgi:CubicO group peptidase (beta-lactamase class C family)
MAHDSIFRIFSMTKPIVSVGIMMLVEDGHFLLSDPVAKFIPEFADQKVGVENDGKLELVPLARPMTVQDLLRHTSGHHLRPHRQRPGAAALPAVAAAQPQDHQRRARRHGRRPAADLPARRGMELQPLHRHSRPHHRGRQRQTLGAFLTERILAPLQMAETAFHTGEQNAGRLAEPFPNDPWTGEKVQLFNMLERPVMESGGGGLVSTTMDYARFCQMLLNGGTLDGNRIIGRKTLELMASDHLGPSVKINSHADAARPRFWPRLCGAHASGRHGAVPGLASASSSGAAWPARSSGSIRRRSCSRCS